ncbi:hypothetical protein EYF80_004970 [Liparis tanakae]|uniref:Uncharacterized protein n=1 Tax=Liparis tanakae TaxID=230148 RepID=A0A4Z2J3K4_9TELE|nr:hypothetical protein EYF80_004970 [Liparis tanakae]
MEGARKAIKEEAQDPISSFFIKTVTCRGEPLDPVILIIIIIIIIIIHCFSNPHQPGDGGADRTETDEPLSGISFRGHKGDCSSLLLLPQSLLWSLTPDQRRSEPGRHRQTGEGR